MTKKERFGAQMLQCEDCGDRQHFWVEANCLGRLKCMACGSVWLKVVSYNGEENTESP